MDNRQNKDGNLKKIDNEDDKVMIWTTSFTQETDRN